jgi:hypothetical protein
MLWGVVHNIPKPPGREGVNVFAALGARLGALMLPTGEGLAG